MVEFEGTYFDGKSAKPHQVKVIGDKTRIRIKEKTGELPEIIVPLAACKFTPPLGHTRRSIILPDNARCETDYLKALAVMETLTGAGRWDRIIDLLESRWKIVLTCLTVLVLIVWGLTILGIPFLARKAADAVPFAVTEKLSNQTLAMLEKQYFGPSELDPRPSNRAECIRPAIWIDADDRRTGSVERIRSGTDCRNGARNDSCGKEAWIANPVSKRRCLYSSFDFIGRCGIDHRSGRITAGTPHQFRLLATVRARG
jgi:hypothetical protein